LGQLFSSTANDKKIGEFHSKRTKRNSAIKVLVRLLLLVHWKWSLKRANVGSKPLLENWSEDTNFEN
jgi:hypothetical protein